MIEEKIYEPTVDYIQLLEDVKYIILVTTFNCWPRMFISVFAFRRLLYEFFAFKCLQRKVRESGNVEIQVSK